MKQKFISEFFGTTFLLMIVVGSGIMGENLANGNEAIVLLTNSLATGAHFNPVVSLVEMFWKRLNRKELFFLLGDTILGRHYRSSDNSLYV